MSRESDFWTRRKARVREEELAEAQAADIAEEQARQTALEQKADEEILRELNLPDPETLQPGDDVKAFMARAVPARLRQRALRRLWLTNPALANLDGLLDYGEDFTDSATVIENLQTAYQVGKGMLRHVEDMARQAGLDEAAEIGAEPAEDEDDGDIAAAEAPESLTEAPAAREDEADSFATLPRRRIQFTFDVPEDGAA